jgi:hypothetical protein
VLDNLALAVQAACPGSSLRFWRPRATERGVSRSALALADRVGLGANAIARRHLAHGEQRQLEVAWRSRRTQAAAARRTDGRHGPRRIGAHGRAARILRASMTIL